jgi:hypothetical protein
MFTKDGKRYTGKAHKMPNGQTHSGATHTASSERLFKTKEAAMAYGKKSKKAPKPSTAPKKSMSKKKKKGY